MKLRLSREALAEAVAWAAQALPGRSSTPALTGLLLTADQYGEAGGALTVSGFDYELSARFVAPADVLAAGRALVPGRLLAELARALPADGHDVELATDGTDVTLSCGPVRFELPVIPPEDYPQLPSLPSALGTVDGAAFAEAVAQVAVVAGKDDALPVLTGIRLEFRPASLRLVATDRYRLAVRELPWAPVQDAALTEETPLVALVPARALHEIARSLTRGERVVLAPSVEDAHAGGLIGFAADAREATTRLLGADFITYERIFPAAYTGSAVVERGPLLEAVRRIGLVTERHQPLRLAFSAGQVLVDAGGGSEARGRQALPARFDAEPVTLAANASYLVDGLNALSCREVALNWTTPGKPAVLTPHPGDGEPVTDYRYLFMPLRTG